RGPDEHAVVVLACGRIAQPEKDTKSGRNN
ncbi:unnamed protein product, partial [marine sediment metagenome]